MLQIVQQLLPILALLALILLVLLFPSADRFRAWHAQRLQAEAQNQLNAHGPNGLVGSTPAARGYAAAAQEATWPPEAPVRPTVPHVSRYRPSFGAGRYSG